jgi:hypothetical protein
MRSLLERLVFVSFAGLVACSGGQGGDPGQTTGGSAGVVGHSGSGGSAGHSGQAGAAGSAGGAGCIWEHDGGGLGVVSAELDRESPQLEQTVAFDHPPRAGSEPQYTVGLQRFGRDLVAMSFHSMWLIELGDAAGAQRIDGNGFVRTVLPYDLDGDGDDDMLGFGEQGGEPRARLWERDGDALIQHEGFWLSTSFRFRALTAGDVDGDGDLDIASIADEGPIVMRNDGAFGFTRIEGSAPLGQCVGCALAVQLRDVDGDEVLDLIVVLYLSLTDHDTFIAVQRGDGSGVFGDATLTKVGGHFLPRRIFYDDLNGDAHFDFAFTRDAPVSETIAVYGAADGAFMLGERLDYVIDDLVDLDEDGELDIVTIEETAVVLRYARDGLFDERRFALSPLRLESVVVEPARGGGSPKAHMLFEQECGQACSDTCGACVFDICADCLNHADCPSGQCRNGACYPDREDASEEDAGMN